MPVTNGKVLSLFIGNECEILQWTIGKSRGEERTKQRTLKIVYYLISVKCTYVS
jgi:hypothetical protein